MFLVVYDLGRCLGAMLHFNMNSQVWTRLPQRMNEIAANRQQTISLM